MGEQNGKDREETQPNPGIPEEDDGTGERIPRQMVGDEPDCGADEGGRQTGGAPERPRGERNGQEVEEGKRDLNAGPEIQHTDHADQYDGQQEPDWAR